MKTTQLTPRTKNKKMETSVMIITPEMAESFLLFNNENRNLRNQHVEYFAKLITQGEFQLTHQGVAFTGNIVNPKRLLDGQHRLQAIVKAGTPVEMLVSWNCDEKLFHTIDAGASRTFRDLHKWNNKQVTIVKSISEIATLSGRVKMSKTDADTIMASFGKEISMLIDRAGTNRKGIATAPTRAAVVILMKKYPEEAESILNSYKHLTNERLDLLRPIEQRLYTRLVRIDGGGASIWTERLLLTMKALSPKSRNSTSLVQYKNQKAKMATIADFVKSQIGL